METLGMPRGDTVLGRTSISRASGRGSLLATLVEVTPLVTDESLSSPTLRPKNPRPLPISGP